MKKILLILLLISLASNLAAETVTEPVQATIRYQGKVYKNLKMQLVSYDATSKMWTVLTPNKKTINIPDIDVARNSKGLFEVALKKLDVKKAIEARKLAKEAARKKRIAKSEQAISRIKIIQDLGKGSYLVRVTRNYTKTFTANLLTEIDFLDGAEIWYDADDGDNTAMMLVNGTRSKLAGVDGAYMPSGTFGRHYVNNKLVPYEKQCSSIMLFSTGKNYSYNNVNGGTSKVAQYTFSMPKE